MISLLEIVVITVMQKRGKVTECKGIQLLDREVIKALEKDGYKYLGILEFD